MPQLPADCLNEIFEYLEEEVITKSCLLVNNLWCEVSVRILWRNIRNYRTLIACLPNESKEILHKNKIIISHSITKPPLFNYATFIKSLSIYNIDSIIKSILQNYQSITPQSLNHKKYIVTKEIYKLFMKQISLRELYFNSYKIIDIPNITFTSYTGTKDCLKYLSRLSCRSDLYPEFFYQLSQLCHLIQYLYITFEKIISNGLTDLISVQKNLKHLYIMQSFDCEDLTGVIQSLTKLPDTLIKFELYGGKHFIPLSFISKFTNLQELVLSFDYNYAIEGFKKLQYIIFSHLEILKFEYAYPKYELIKFLENNGKNLKEFYIGNSDDSLNLAIAKFCPNLKKFFTIFKNNELGSLKKIFASCQYLESIKIWCGDRYLRDKEVLDVVVKHSPKNFYELKIYYVINAQSEILPEELEQVFINWKNRIPQKSLSFIITKGSRAKSLEVKKENMEIIEKYRMLGIIKKIL
ncbi:hypothetical protein C1645_837159 [Glomus cerebriforme]|uniref:F-box domain-containing protein n=1 Tax=Glomus cerebriforme TaxID=658196 RepID=A0A397SF16_9GLOM|nr:hypothetical protein C1645_837159 [Glomus cerebriforme]